MNQENNFGGIPGPKCCSGEKGPIGGPVVDSRVSAGTFVFIPRSGKSSYPEVPENIPGSLLTSDDLGELQEIASFLSSQCDRLSPIGDYYEERRAALWQQQHCNSDGDKEESLSQPQPTVTAAIYAGRGDTETYSRSKNLHEADGLNQEGFQCSVGPTGRSGDNPIDSILWDMRELINKIETLCDTGILQTRQDLSAVQSSLHLSEDGGIHVRTDIAIDTRNLLSQLNIRQDPRES